MNARTHSINQAVRNHLRVMPLIVLIAHGAMTFAQAPGTPAPANPEPENPLAGPRVAAPNSSGTHADGSMMQGETMDPAELAKLSIVERDFAGQLIRLEIRAEKAAAEKLPLTAKQRSELNDFFTQRSTEVLQFTLKNYDQFIKLQGARQARSRQELPKLMSEMRTTAGEWVSKPLADRVEEKLPEHFRAHFRRMVNEYNDEVAKSDPRSGAPADGVGARLRRGGFGGEFVELNNFIREMAREFSGMVAQRREQLDTLLKAVDATPEQESKIRAIVREGNGAPGTEPSPRQRRETIRKALAELTPAQQKLWQQAQAAQIGMAPMPGEEPEPATTPKDEEKKTPASKPASEKR